MTDQPIRTLQGGIVTAQAASTGAIVITETRGSGERRIAVDRDAAGRLAEALDLAVATSSSRIVPDVAVLLATQVSPQVARNVLYLFTEPWGRAEGSRPGGFYRHLYDAMSSADPWNLRRIEREFPGEVAAHRLAAHHDGELDQLRKLAEGKDWV